MDDGALPPAPEAPHEDVYLPKFPCPVGFYGQYVRTAVDTDVLTVWMWRCSAGPPP